ncbi:MAG: hypothetical protein ACK58U_02705 [Rubrivivax sp.]|jgi:ankyrin repeat protein
MNERPVYYEPGPGQGQFTELMHAARWAFVGDLKREIKAGANVNAQDSSGFTAMIWNLRMGGPKEFKRRKRVFRLLLKAGASPTIQDLSGLDALGTARKFSNKALKRFVNGQLCRPCPCVAFHSSNQTSSKLKANAASRRPEDAA